MSEPMQDEGITTAAPRALTIRFTGSGSEYFRIWIVNLLLTVVTVGLYFPFAKARRLAYFYSNTVVDGQALAFHGNPWKMLRGFLLLAALTAAYGVAGRLSPVSGLIAFLLLAAVWPALWRASLQFRLGNTSWRGLRFGFRGDLKGAYLAVLPVYAPLALMLAAQVYFGPPAAMRGEPMSGVQAGLIFSPIIVLYLMFPWALALIKRYQHGGYVYAAQQTQLDASGWSFYKLSLKGLGVMLMGLLIVGTLGAVAAVMTRAAVAEDLPKAWLFAALLPIYLIYFALTAPYFTVRLQNLVWNGTHCPAIRFASALRFWPMAGLTLKNWLLTALTLSLYRPFAVVATTRLRLAAVRVKVSGELDSWMAQQPGDSAQNAAGDAAGDFFGIDMGL